MLQIFQKLLVSCEIFINHKNTLRKILQFVKNRKQKNFITIRKNNLNKTSEQTKISIIKLLLVEGFTLFTSKTEKEQKKQTTKQQSKTQQDVKTQRKKKICNKLRNMHNKRNNISLNSITVPSPLSHPFGGD